MNQLCPFGEEKVVGRGIFFICKKTGDHCSNHSRWCSIENHYVGVGDCKECNQYIIQQAENDKNTKVEKETEKSVKTQKIEAKKEI